MKGGISFGGHRDTEDSLYGGGSRISDDPLYGGSSYTGDKAPTPDAVSRVKAIIPTKGDTEKVDRAGIHPSSKGTDLDVQRCAHSVRPLCLLKGKGS